jgi:putative endonuclease
MSESRQQVIGKWGESLAADFLSEKGYKILARNVRTEYGEIDLIVTRGDVLIFVEVKTRTSNEFGYPEDAITNKKKEHLLASAQAYLQNHSEFEGDWRIDVIAIWRKDRNAPQQIIHFENALTS